MPDHLKQFEKGVVKKSKEKKGKRSRKSKRRSKTDKNFEEDTNDDLSEHFKDTSDVLEAPEIEIDEDWLPEDELDDDLADDLEDVEDDLLLSSSATKRSRSNKNVHDCRYCKKHCKSKAALTMHIYKVHGVSTKNRLLCRHCFKQFIFQYELDVHTMFTCKRVKRSFECSVCKAQFCTKTELNEHPCSKDAGKPFFCTIQPCKYACKSVKSLREHCVRHLQIKPYLCNTCGCAFSTKKDMDRHAEKHKDTRDLVCPHCDKAYKSKPSLRKHILEHKFKDRFKCRVCSYGTAYHNNFKQHMLKHVDRKHKCNLCNKSLRSASSLSDHMEKIHSFNKLFTCQYCDFTTSVGKKYSGHMRKHRSEKEDEEYESDEEMSLLNLSDNATITESLPQTCNLPLQVSTAIPMMENHLPNIIPSSNISLTSDPCLRSPPLSSHISVLTDTTLGESEEVEISGHGADALMSNIVVSSYSDIPIPQDASNTNLAFYVTDMPGSEVNVAGPPSMSMASLIMPDTVPSMADSENWCSSDQS